MLHCSTVIDVRTPTVGHIMVFPALYSINRHNIDINLDGKLHLITTFSKFLTLKILSFDLRVCKAANACMQEWPNCVYMINILVTCAGKAIHALPLPHHGYLSPVHLSLPLLPDLHSLPQPPASSAAQKMLLSRFLSLIWLLE